MLLKKSFENVRLLDMLRARRSTGRRGNDGTTARGQKQKFYSSNLGDRVPSDHLLRGNAYSANYLLDTADRRHALPR